MLIRKYVTIWLDSMIKFDNMSIIIKMYRRYHINMVKYSYIMIISTYSEEKLWLVKINNQNPNQAIIT